jgi:hypothetical protein
MLRKDDREGDRIDVLRAPSPMVARHSQLSDTLCLRKKC